MSYELEVYADLQALAGAAAERFAIQAAEARKQRGRFCVALSGGSTPRLLYTLLGESPYVERVDWSRVDLFWGDERAVPPEHPDSNYRMAREALIERVPIPEENVHRMAGELDPRLAAAAYEELLRTYFRQQGRPEPEFDLVLLGMGDDGHTASLFPHTAALNERDRWVVAHYVQKLDAWRLTLTFRAINQARKVVFLVSGKKKSSRLKQVLEGSQDEFVLPARGVKPVIGKVIWMVDQAAARALVG